MDKLQFLDLTDLNPSEEEQLTSLLYNVEFPEAVELPPENPPSWLQQAVPYPDLPPVLEIPAPCCATTWIPAAYPGVVLEQEPVNGDGSMAEMEQPVDYAAGSHMMAPQTVQYTQMMPTPSVYVSNVTANVNVHSFMPPQAMPYPTAMPFMPSVDAQLPAARKPRPSKTPTKRSPEVRRTIESPQTNYTPPFTQPFPMAYHQSYYYPISAHPMPQAIPRPFVGVPPVYSPTAPPVYSGYAPVFTPSHHVQQPPAEPREENPVPYLEKEEEEEEEIEQPVYQQQASEEEEQAVVGTVIVENSTLQQAPEEVVSVLEIQEEEVKVEKPLVTKAPPANAFKSAPNLTQKPPFPPTPKQKRSSIDDGPQFIDPPVESGPPKKSYAQMAQSDSAAAKPLAMIHPTVHNNVNDVSPRVQNFVEKPHPPSAQEISPSVSFSKSLKVRPDKMILPDYDINMQRLGEFLSTYSLDHKPVLLQPRGLTNRSNYCYINAILQALIACPPFYNLMRSVPPAQESKSSKSRTPIIDSMVKFVNEFSLMSLNTRPVGRREKIQATKDGNAGSSEVVTGPSFEPVYVYKMLSAMHAAFPVEGRQEDAEEFLSCLLNGLNDEMLEALKLVEPPSNGLTNGVTTNGEPATNGDSFDQDLEWTEVVSKNNKSVVTRRAEFGKTPLSTIFRGQIRSRVIRVTGAENGTTDNVQPFFTLQLDVEKANSVEKALELLVGKDEVMGGTCPKTNQEISMFTQTSLEELPLILLLHLKCFDYKLHTCSKIMKTVEFPVDLKIDSKLLTSKSKTSTKDRQYKLLAVVYHDGKEATKGHYLTDVYHMGYSGWVRYDDASVRPVSQQQVLNPKTPRVPYLLYYRRCDTIGLSDHNR